MAKTTMRLGLLLILALTIIQISKGEKEDESQMEQKSEGNMMASSMEEVELRTVREAGRRKVRSKKPKKKCNKKNNKNCKRKGRKNKLRKKKGGKVRKRKNKLMKKGKKKNKKGNQEKGDLKKKKRVKKLKGKKKSAISGRQTCDEAALCQKIKDYIKYSNQLRKVKRIVKSCDTMEKKANKSATEFDATVAALDEIIASNAKRRLYIRWRRTQRSTDEVVAIRDNLKNCSVSAKAKCEKKVEPACLETALHTECEASLQAWLNSFGPSKGSCLQASADCCACITALPTVDAKCLDFDTKSTNAVASKKKCTGGTETGSFGFCRKQQQEASVKGPPAACGGSTATKAPPSATTAAGATTAAPAASTAAPDGSTTSCTCGKKNTRILGGADANKMEYPWMVSLIDATQSSHFCGGSVINSRWVQTAAHCVSVGGGIPATTVTSISALKVRVGDHNIASTTESDKVKDFEVEEIHVHKNSSGLPSYMDLALIKVKTAIDLTVYTPLCMPASGFDIRGKKVTLAGWGIKSCVNPDNNIDCNNPAPTEATILQELVDMTVPDAATCTAAYGGDTVSAKIFCWGGEEGKSGCFGDSGSGLIYNNNGKYTLVGSVSTGTGNGCGKAGAYGVSNTVADFRSWYDATATGGSYCDA